MSDNKIQVFKTSDSKIINTEMLIAVVAVAWILIANTPIHPAIAVLIGVVSGIGLFLAFRTPIGYIIVTTIFSLLWGFIGGSIANSLGDLVWGIIIGIIVFLASIGSHQLAKRYHDNVVEA